MMIDQLREWLVEVVESLNWSIDREEIQLEHPVHPEHGDYATNLALILFPRIKKEGVKIDSPLALAQLITSKLIASKARPRSLVAKIEVAPPGFINFWLAQDYLINQAMELLDEEKFAKKMARIKKGKKYLLEHTSPDPIKTIHIGHLRNNFLGMAVHNLLEFLGAEVTLDCVNNDRGTHVSRAIWGYLVFGAKKKGEGISDYRQKIKNYQLSDQEVELLAQKVDWQELLSQWAKNQTDWYLPEDLGLRSDKFNNCFYSLGQRASDLVKGVADQVQQLLKAWEEENQDLRRLWRQIIDWSLAGYQKTYQRIGSRHDRVWHESNYYQLGKKWVEKGLKKGIFRKLPDGAILTDLKDYHLPDTILIKSDGTALYLTQDLQLTHQKVTTYPSDLYLWDIGNEQSLYLKQLFAVCDQLGIAPQEKLFHLNYGFITLKGGVKMSSRYGGVINADDLLDELHRRAGKIIATSNQELRGGMTNSEKEALAEAVALAACKYGFLKYSRERDFAFDIDQSLSLQGDSGPYLQYTFARCLSVLRKAFGSQSPVFSTPRVQSLQPEEQALLRTFYQFPEILVIAADQFAPHLLCQYLFDLAQKFNLFYQRHRILDWEPETKNSDSKGNFRLLLTAATAQILRTGLKILGIQTPERM